MVWQIDKEREYTPLCKCTSSGERFGKKWFDLQTRTCHIDSNLFFKFQVQITMETVFAWKKPSFQHPLVLNEKERTSNSYQVIVKYVNV